MEIRGVMCIAREHIPGATKMNIFLNGMRNVSPFIQILSKIETLKYQINYYALLMLRPQNLTLNRNLPRKIGASNEESMKLHLFRSPTA